MYLLSSLQHLFRQTSSPKTLAPLLQVRSLFRWKLKPGPIVMFIDTIPNKQADLLKGQGGGGGGMSLDLSPLIANGPGKVVLITEVTIE
jgi:hypothetical protein